MAVEIGFGSLAIYGVLRFLDTSRTAPHDSKLDPNYSLINTRNIDEVYRRVREKATNYPLMTLDNIPLVPLGSQLEGFKDVNSYDVNLDQYGIQSFSFLRMEINRQRNPAILVRFFENVKLGEPFYANPKGTPYPAFIFILDEKVERYKGPAGYLLEPAERKSDLPLKYCLIFFPEISKGNEDTKFVIHFNAGLLNVHGVDLPAFSLPVQFLIPRKTPPLPAT